jgi:hypothetical protein
LRLDGTVVADNKAALTNAASVDLKAAINLDENSQTLSGTSEVWTGTNPDGTPGVSNCVDWTSNNPDESGQIGIKDFTNGFWTDDGEDPCTQGKRLYCFSAPPSN